MADIQAIFNQAQDAIQHKDDVLARKLLREIEGVLALGQQHLDPKTFLQLGDLKLKLTIVNFPNLSEEGACDVLRNHYLDAYSIEVSMENRLTAMLFFYPEIPREELRKKLKNALLQNQQRIGQLPIGQWLIEFEKMFPVATRDLSASVRFSIEHPQARTLSPIERENLKEMLHTYDYLLVTTLPATGPILEQFLQSPISADDQQTFAPQVANIRQSNVFVPNPNFQNRNQSNVPAQPLLEMTLAQALKSFPNLGEESVTINPLKLRYFKNSVRPSIKNWITDYHDALGASKHGAIERGNFLFQSENGKRLTPMERQKISMLLKSLDEETLLEIDGDKQQVIFDFAGEKMVNQTSSNNRPAVKQEPRIFQADPLEDLAQTRIRQALNFNKNVPAINGEKPFAYEEGNYADTFQQTTLEESKKTPDNLMKNNLGENQQTQFGSLHFSSAQELPVEKNNFRREGLAVPTRETQKAENVQLVQPAQAFNSPNFKRHLEPEPEDIFEKKRPASMTGGYVNYSVNPTRDYRQASQNEVTFKENEPKNQGNVVDLR